MNKDDIDELIRAAFNVASAPLSDLRAAALYARDSAAHLTIDTTDEDHMAADVEAYTALAAAAEMLDLLVTYRQVQLWTREGRPIDLHPEDDHENGEQQR